MRTRFESFGFFAGFKLAKVLRPVVKAYGHPEANIESLRYSIDVLNDALRNRPNDILLWHSLSDFYLKANEFALFLMAAKKAYEIKPSDARSLYFLATAYHVLTWSRFIDHPSLANLSSHQLERMGLLSREKEIKSRSELQYLNMTVEEAAEQSIRYFRMTLEAGITMLEKEVVLVPLNALCQAFPQFDRDYDPSGVKPTTKGQGEYEMKQEEEKRRDAILAVKPARKFLLGQKIVGDEMILRYYVVYGNDELGYIGSSEEFYAPKEEFFEVLFDTEIFNDLSGAINMEGFYKAEASFKALGGTTK